MGRVTVYRYDDLVDLYRSMPIPAGTTISIKTDLLALGRFEVPRKQAILQAHLDAIDKVFSLEKSTLVVATSTTHLCETDTPYDHDQSTSNVGVFTEFVRNQPGALRSFHAFESYAALGSAPESICSDTSPVSYGCESPEERLVQAGAWCIVIGANPIRCCSTIHYLEQVVGVPYRYIREYDHPVIREGERFVGRFYRNPWYRKADVQKDTSRFFEQTYKRGFEIHRYPLGSGAICAYSLRDLYQCGVSVLHTDPYLCLSHTPTIQPWRQ